MQFRRRNRCRNAIHLAHALFHHGSALAGVRVLVADQHAIFIVFVAGDNVGVTRQPGNRPRRNSALGDLVSLVRFVVAGPVRGDHFAAIDHRIEIKFLWVDAQATFRKQKIAEHDARTLEAGR